MLATPMLDVLMLTIQMLAIIMLVIHRLAILMLAIPMLAIPMLAILMFVVPSLEISNKLEVLLFTNALGRYVNVQTHKNLEFNEIQRRAPLFMVSKEKLEVSSWRIHSTKDYKKWVRNEKLWPFKVCMAKKSKKCHTQHKETVLKTPNQSLYVGLLPLEFQDEL
jgi:hypothetical protein